MNGSFVQRGEEQQLIDVIDITFVPENHTQLAARVSSLLSYFANSVVVSSFEHNLAQLRLSFFVQSLMAALKPTTTLLINLLEPLFKTLLSQATNPLTPSSAATLQFVILELGSKLIEIQQYQKQQITQLISMEPTEPSKGTCLQLELSYHPAKVLYEGISHAEVAVYLLDRLLSVGGCEWGKVLLQPNPLLNTLELHNYLTHLFSPTPVPPESQYVIALGQIDWRGLVKRMASGLPSISSPLYLLS